MSERVELKVERTARYFVRGNDRDPAEVWLLLHGYAQTADAFLDDFEALDDGTRLLVAPEGLSRFYRRGTHGEVGASWMTRVEREAEIEDTLVFLQAVHDRVLAGLRGEPELHLLGFSQGGAAAARLAARGRCAPRRLVLWGSGLAPELVAEPGRLAELERVLVLGTRDPWIDEARADKERARLEEAGLGFRTLRFEGGHEIDADALRRLAAGQA